MNDEIMRERNLVLSARIVAKHIFDDETGNNISLREFARMLNESHGSDDHTVSYQTIKNWLDGVHIPKQSWLDWMIDNAESDSLAYELANEIHNAIWSEVSL